MSKWSNPQEIRIPIPYGYIAAKAWGEEQHEPVLALHGWQDNAGTFDTLIPLLEQDLYIIAIDSPGHGLSSHKPAGAYYNYMESLVEIKQIVDYFKWQTFSIIGHSLGGISAILYSSVFTEKVKNLVLLDILKPHSSDTAQLPHKMRKGIDNLVEFQNKLLNPAPVYSREDAQKRLIDGMHRQISPESANILLKRGCQPSKCGKGVVFSRDIRIQQTFALQIFSHEDVKGYLRNVTCNVLIILSKDTPELNKTCPPEDLDDFLKLYEESAKLFKFIQVDGQHLVHLNHPERVAPFIDTFFKQSYTDFSKL